VARRLAPLLVGVVLVLAGCSAEEPTPPSGFVTGTSLHTINVGGRDRTYRLYKPAGLSTLACNTGVFAAIGPDAATQLDPCRSPRPTSVMHIHGTADPLVPYQGGQGFSVINRPSVAEVNAFWRNVDRCGAPEATTSGQVTTSTAGCADNRSVVLMTIDGGGHIEWPSSFTQKLWAFFAAHPA
jgi:poly(3-hydroxybutyrate) depolymerase